MLPKNYQHFLLKNNTSILKRIVWENQSGIKILVGREALELSLNKKHVQNIAKEMSRDELDKLWNSETWRTLQKWWAQVNKVSY